ncbi:hypothetical protein BGZ63DRAFT_229762 [Mariannaea sp. PMI_226]|nr:hypothetical protein BGZ63DRAFT_229762 [Mariannaea sp. PMI_226]
MFSYDLFDTKCLCYYHDAYEEAEARACWANSSFSFFFSFLSFVFFFFGVEIFYCYSYILHKALLPFCQNSLGLGSYIEDWGRGGVGLVMLRVVRLISIHIQGALGSLISLLYIYFELKAPLLYLGSFSAVDD